MMKQTYIDRVYFEFGMCHENGLTLDTFHKEHGLTDIKQIKSLELDLQINDNAKAYYDAGRAEALANKRIKRK